MAEFTYNPVQRVEAGQNIILNTNIRCPKGYVLHRNESGIVILRGIVNNPNCCFARYQVTFNGNIAIPSDGTAPAPISIALAIDGEPVLTSRAIAGKRACDVWRIMNEIMEMLKVAEPHIYRAVVHKINNL